MLIQWWFLTLESRKKLEVSSIEDAIQLMPSTDSVELIEDYNDLFEIKNLCFIARLVGAHLHW